MKKVVVFFVTVLCSLNLYSFEIQFREGFLDITEDVWDLNQEISNNPNENLIGICQKIRQIETTIFCLFKNQEMLNKIYTRASIFSEGYGEKLPTTIIEVESEILKNDIMSGLNIPGKNLLSFNELVNSGCLNNEKVCYTDLENHFFSYLNKSDYFTNEKAYLIAASIGKSDGLFDQKSFITLVSHEFNHAYYYTHDKYREIYEDYYYNEVAFYDRFIVRKLLEAYGYNTEDRNIVLDESHAYIMEQGGIPESGFLAYIASYLLEKYKVSFLEYLDERFVLPTIK